MSNDGASVDCDAVIACVREAGQLAMESWREGEAPASRVWEKSKGHMVCEADLAVDEMLRARLNAVLPGSGWLSEETADDPARLDCEQIWLVDPIDGTRDYIRGRPGWCISVALARAGQADFAVMYAPATDQLWTAKAGQGAYCNGAKLRASRQSGYAGARIPLDPDVEVDDLVKVEKPNSIAMRMAMVACDRADLVISLRWGSEWDIAASHLISAEAGAQVTDGLGGEIRYNKPKPMDFGVLCCAPAIHGEMVGRMKPHADRILKETPEAP